MNDLYQLELRRERALACRDMCTGLIQALSARVAHLRQRLSDAGRLAE